MKKLFAFAVAAVVLAVFAVAVGALRGRGGVATQAVGEETISGAANTGAGRRSPVVVELFTSEGCSSCPPADAVLSRLEKTQPVEGAEVIALAEHVDYWNYLGWRDPFSSAEHSARQREYAQAFGKDGIYTPQMVVDGRAEFVGSDNSKAVETIAKAARSPKADVTLALVRERGTEAPDVRLSVRVGVLPPVSTGDTAEVLLAITEGDLSTSVPRGENAGRRLSHVGVVRRLSVIGSAATGEAFAAEPSVTLERDWRRENLRAVVFVQERASRRVLGAAAIKLGG